MASSFLWDDSLVRLGEGFPPTGQTCVTFTSIDKGEGYVSEIGALNTTPFLTKM